MSKMVKKIRKFGGQTKEILLSNIGFQPFFTFLSIIQKISLLKPIQAKSSIFQAIQANSYQSQPMIGYSNPFQSIPSYLILFKAIQSRLSPLTQIISTCSSLYQPTNLVNYGIFQPNTGYVSLFLSIQDSSSL